MLTLLKYSTHDCPICEAMAGFDARVARELGLAYVDVDLKTPEIYRRYRPVLLQQYPLKREMKLPTYLLVEQPEAAFQIHGELSGRRSEAEFRSSLEAMIKELESNAEA